MVDASLLEREPELGVLRAAVVEAAAGRGSVVLVLGEAGIGKTSLLRAFLDGVGGSAAVLSGSCDDLLTPRALGPLRDAARGRRGPLADALAGANPGAVFSAVTDELSGGAHPTVLVVEDVHWADSATLDVVRYVGRRIGELPAVLLLTYRDDELGREHPLRGVLGGLTGPQVRRLVLRRLSPAAVSALAARTDVDPEALHRLTDGNPFYVTEALAAPGQAVPSTVVDAVLARLSRLSPDAQACLDQLAVVPSRVDLPLLRELCDDLAPIAEAEGLGVLEVGPDAVAFRHELARRAVFDSLPTTVRRQLNARVLRVLLDREPPDLFRVLHHAAAAGDDAVIAAFGPAAARDASFAGAHRQAVACYEQVLRGDLLSADERATLLDEYAWALYNVHELDRAVEAAAAAVRLWEQSGDVERLAQGLVTLSRQQWLVEQPAAALASAERARMLLEGQGDSAVQASVLLNSGAMLVVCDREVEAIGLLDEALAMAQRVGATAVVALAHNYRGSAALQLGDAAGEQELLHSVEIAEATGHHEYVTRGLYNLVEGLWRLGRHDDAIGYGDRAVEYARDRDFQIQMYFFAARRYRLLALRGRWDEAEAGIRALLDGQGDPGMPARETVPVLARILVRRGGEDAADVLALAAEHSNRADNLEWLIPTALGHIEHAWLTGQPELARPWAGRLLARTDRPGTERQRGELLRWLQRLGEPVVPFPGCPEPYAAALAGDWRRAADGHTDPYERALELAESGSVEPTLEALAVLEELGAEPAAAIVRRRLRGLGVVRSPRRQQTSTGTNPAGLTDRQVEILRLLGAGLTNAQIARRLLVSVRTVDHHVSAVLQKLGVRTRREAAATAMTLDMNR